jgi:hypothetical protein
LKVGLAGYDSLLAEWCLGKGDCSGEVQYQRLEKPSYVALVAVEDTGSSCVTGESKCLVGGRLDSNYVYVGDHGVGEELHAVGWRMGDGNIG